MKRSALYYAVISMVISTIGYFAKETDIAIFVFCVVVAWSFLGLVLIVLEVRGLFALLRGYGSNALELAESNPHPYREPAPNIEPTELDGVSEEERKVEVALYLITMDLGRPMNNRVQLRPRTPDINAPPPKPIIE